MSTADEQGQAGTRADVRLVVFDLMSADPDYYFVLTQALGDFAAGCRGEGAGGVNPEANSKWAETAEQMVAQAEEVMSRGPVAQPWDALKAHLSLQVEQDSAVMRSFRQAGDEASASSYGGLVSANSSTLAKMQALEAGNG